MAKGNQATQIPDPVTPTNPSSPVPEEEDTVTAYSGSPSQPSSNDDPIWNVGEPRRPSTIFTLQGLVKPYMDNENKYGEAPTTNL